jgi:hypothetical protein
MEKSSQRRIDFVLKRKRDGTNENEDPLVAANDILSLLQLEQQQQNNDDGFRTNEPVTFRGIEYYKSVLPGRFPARYLWIATTIETFCFGCFQR